MIKNKKGNIEGIIILVVCIFVVLFAGIFLAFGGLTIDWVFDEAMPELTGIGMVGNANVTQAVDIAITPVDTLVQNFTWLSGVIYIIALLSCFGLAFAFRFTGNKWLMGFFIGCMILLLIASIFISNIYQDFYDDNTDVGTRLHEQTMLSFLVLYSPMIMVIIGFICGVIMFTGDQEETQTA